MRDNLCDSEDLIDMRTRKMVLNWTLIFWKKLFLQVLLSSTTLEKGVLVSRLSLSLSLSLSLQRGKVQVHELLYKGCAK
jgi:hypothetical protein